MKHLQYPDKEVTLIFSFAGTLDKDLYGNFDNLENGSILKTIVEECSLIRHINENTFQTIPNVSVSMSLVVCNFLKNDLEIKDPYFTSGKLDATHPRPRNIKPSSVDLLFTRKKSLDMRGSVGLTVITVQHCLRLHSFAVYWQAPFDFNLYKNSFAVIPLTDQHFGTCQDVLKTFKNFLPSNNMKTEDRFDGIRGFAKDGPKALEFCGMLISVRMGVQHNDSLQISILPLEHLDK